MKSIKKNMLGILLLCLLICNIYPTYETPVVVADENVEARAFFTGIFLIATAAIVTGLVYWYDTDNSTRTGDRLYRACHEGDLDQVKTILCNIDDINAARFTASHAFECPPILFGCNNLGVLQWMVEEKGADVNTVYNKEIPGVYLDENDGRYKRSSHFYVIWEKQSTPLYRACRSRDLPVVEYLIEKGVNVRERSYYSYDTTVGVTPLYIACYSGNLAIVRTLLDNGADADLESDNRNVWNRNSREVIIEKPIHVAARQGHVHIIRELLRRGAAFDARNNKGKTAIHCDEDWGNCSNIEKREVIRLFLEHDADILHMRDNEGNTPLHSATWNCTEGIFRFLIANGADINARNNKGETPLLFACQSPRLFGANFGVAGVVSYLMSHGADINGESDEGKNALYFACTSQRRDSFDDRNNKYLAEAIMQLGAEVKDEYEFGGILKRGDRGLDFDVEKLLNKRVAKKRELKEAMKALLEDGGESDKAKVRVENLMLDEKMPTCAKKRWLPKLFELHKNNENLVSSQDIEKYLEQVVFDESFEKDETYKEIVVFAKNRKIKGKYLE